MKKNWNFLKFFEKRKVSVSEKKSFGSDTDTEIGPWIWFPILKPGFGCTLLASAGFFINQQYFSTNLHNMSRFQIIYSQNHEPNPNWYSFKMSKNLRLFQKKWLSNAKLRTKGLPWQTVCWTCWKYLKYYSTDLPNQPKHLGNYVGKSPYWASVVRAPDYLEFRPHESQSLISR